MTSPQAILTPAISVSRASIWRRRALVALGLGGIVAVSGSMLIKAGYRLNVTPSEPLGIWQSVPANAVHKGETVEVCVPLSPAIQSAKERSYILPGSCPGNMAPLIKPIVAMAGDVVTISTTGILVNGAFVSQTAPAEHDGSGRPLAAAYNGTKTVPEGEVFLISDYSPKSFDSRYFGFVPISGIRGAMKPVLVTNWKPSGY